jgi:hypothetical protein
MIATERHDSYRASERVVLRPGTRFRARGGPVYKLNDGTEVSLAARGPFTFRFHCKTGRVEWIEAVDSGGANAILHIKGKRKTVDEAIVARPYQLKSVIRKKARVR